MPAQKKKFDVAGETVQVWFGGGADLIEHADGETELVDDFEAWMAEHRPETDGGQRAFNGVCPMCGSTYGSYTTHLQHCQPR